MQLIGCPNCREFIDPDLASCWFCGLPLKERDGQLLISLQKQVRQAVLLAKGIQGLVWISGISLVTGIFLPSRAGILFVGSWVLIPIACAFWWLWFERIKIRNQQYLAARKLIKLSFWTWITIMVLCYVGIYVGTIWINSLAWQKD